MELEEHLETFQNGQQKNSKYTEQKGGGTN
jgi:hypothetical protein